MIQVKGYNSEDSLLLLFLNLQNSNKKCQEVYDFFCQFISTVTQRKSRNLLYYNHFEPCGISQSNI
ncbi:unnamed protein product [Paramecium octaurelia]|uniref:Uncharacterized protein n=1 Tax=Paramecium octaurelia TaxID=43137 RepID=A0A8S1WLW7_PAROT|nr:unnamed protein product [Paramecium octaurelia]